MKKELIPFGMGIFVGFILLSMLLGKISWEFNATILIACCALGLTIWQGYQIRVHNRLSVKPLLIDFLEQSPNHITYRLNNKGLGPANIISYQIFADENLLDGLFAFQKDLNNLLAPIYPYELYSSHQTLGSIMDTKDSSLIMDIRAGFISPSYQEIIKKRYTLVVNYESIYGDKYTFNSANYIKNS